MTKPDLIVCWPDTIEFPLFTKFLNEQRHLFEKVIIAFTETNWGPPVTTRIMQGINEALFIPAIPTEPGEDWRSAAVNRALKHSFAPWIWFTEQDFFPKEGFFKQIPDFVENHHVDVIGILDNNRMHPCSLFIKRSILEKTSKDFGAKPEEGYDHFGRIYQDLNKINTRQGFFDARTYYHMAGLTHNLFLLRNGEKPVYKPEEFYEYLDKVQSHEQKLRSPAKVL